MTDVIVGRLPHLDVADLAAPDDTALDHAIRDGQPAEPDDDGPVARFNNYL